MLNRYYGMYQAIVTNVNDPEKRGRIKVQCPTVLGATVESAWCDPCIPIAYDNGGDFCLPQIRESVWLMFIEGNVNKPVYLGGWWSKNKTPLGDNYTNLDDVRIIGYNGCNMVMRNEEINIMAKSLKLNGVSLSPGGGGSSDEVLSAISELQEEFSGCCLNVQNLIEGSKQEILSEIKNLTPILPPEIKTTNTIGFVYSFIEGTSITSIVSGIELYTEME